MRKQSPHALAAILRTATEIPDARAGELWEKYRTTGDPNTFNVLWLWIGNRVYPVLRGLLRTDESTEDAVQAVMLELVTKRDTMPAFEKAKAWLRGVATNIAAQGHRSAGRREVRHQQVAKPDTTTDDHTARTIDQLAVRDALSKLDSTDREIVTLIHFERLTKEQAAAEVGCDPKTFTKRLTAAESRLRDLLAAAGLVAGALTCADAVAVPVRAALNPERVAEMLSNAWAATASGAAGWSKPLLVAAGLLLCGGLALGGWALTRERPPERARQPEPPTPPAPVEPPKPRTLQEENRLIVEQRLRPALEAALAKLVLGEGGRAEIDGIEAHDTRVRLRATLAHGKPLTFKSRVEFLFDTFSKELSAWIAFTDRDEWRRVDPKKPIQTSVPVFGKFSLPLAGLEDLDRVFRSAPWDEARTAGERAAYRARLEKALAPYLGVWYLNGIREGTRTIRLTPADEMQCTDHTGAKWALAQGPEIALDDQTGEPRIMFFGYALSPDKQRLNLLRPPPTGPEFWSRQPTR
ncbi:MAG: RNA polymerase sigma factor, partial [Planctomycetes bacterium]|nr:RNA polymerase sigma factor [Planctomycetota bacterium]